MKYWLMKSEPDVFGIDDLQKATNRTEPWDGIRNYQVRNMLRDEMRPGDLAYFYHSSCKEPGIAGVMKITRAGYPDPTAFDVRQKHYDPKSDPDNPRWYMVDVQYVRHMKRVIRLTELKSYPQLSDLPLVRRGNRLSVLPVTKKQWDFILSVE